MLAKSLVAALIVLAVLSPATLADPLAEGAAAYNKHNYKLAVDKFEQAAKAQPKNSSVYYYLAVGNQALGNVAKAQQYYQLILQRFPGTQAAALAAQALGVNAQPQQTAAPRSNGVAASRQQSANNNATQSTDSIPDESKVYFTLNENNHMIVDVLLNGRRMRCCLDTGADSNLFDKNQLLAAGINPPTGAPNGYTRGWAQTNTPIWNSMANVQLGSIKRTVPISVQENLGSLPCLIGQTFFSDLQYDIDSKGGSITFHKTKRAAGAAAADQDAYDLPFQLRGKHMYVQVEVDGRKCLVFLDTGAYATIFTQADLNSLGLSVPDGAPQTQMSGIDGQVQAHTMTFDHLRLGPILQRDVSVTVIDSGNSCLGQNVLNGWRYTIDNQRKVLKFFH